MNFKDLENVKAGTVLIGRAGDERQFLAVLDSTCFTTYSNNPKLAMGWRESGIEGWQIKKPARKKFSGVFSSYTTRHARDGGDIVITEVIDGIIYEAE